MTDENIDFVLEWFDKYDEKPYDDQHKFENLKKPMHPSEQFSAVAFLYKKLKDSANRFFLHGEHDELYIGSFSDFSDFTEADLIEMTHYGVQLSDERDGFRIYASM